MQTRWKYKVVKFETTGFFGGKVDEVGINEKLDTLGSEGWELVSCFDTSQAHGRTRDVIAVLKRQA
jgi:hypothetical protein